ncbi:hypothetical protein TrLO_g14135 [Triparma laevis f. longispina]|uniref:RING-type E3 ubiquitin transferase BRCA1 n=1 Tax=Triparma laevis f. longispina TaxID=1714387 RepID=A0A9W7C353_9STRA|nr:hypothetical protein TrLO_g14135 [Triparma laevis f. longispina]
MSSLPPPPSVPNSNGTRSMMRSLKKLRSSMSCALCSSIMSTPSALQCGHVFCNSCLLEWTKSNWNCPTCEMPCMSGKERSSIKGNPQMSGIVEALRKIEDTLIKAGPNWWIAEGDEDVFVEVPLEEDAKDEEQEILFVEGDSDEEGQGVEEDEEEEAEEGSSPQTGILNPNKPTSQKKRKATVGVRWDNDNNPDDDDENADSNLQSSPTSEGPAIKLHKSTRFQSSTNSAESDSSLGGGLYRGGSKTSVPSRILKVYVEDEELKPELDGQSYTLLGSLESPDVIVLQACVNEELILSADITWSYLLGLSLGSLIVSTSWLTNPTNKYYTKKWSHDTGNSTSSDSRFVYGHDGCSTFGAPGRMHSSNKKLNKKSDLHTSGTKLFEGYNFFLAGKFASSIMDTACPPTITVDRMRRILSLGRSKTINLLNPQSETPSSKENARTKIIVGGDSNEDDLKEIIDVMVDVWILNVEEIDIVRTEWVVDCVCEGKILELDGGRYLY